MSNPLTLCAECATFNAFWTGAGGGIFQALISKLLTVQGKLFLWWSPCCLGSNDQNIALNTPCICCLALNSFCFFPFFKVYVLVFWHLVYSFCLNLVSLIVCCHALDVVSLWIYLDIKILVKKKSSWKKKKKDIPCHTLKNKNNVLEASHLTKLHQDTLRKTGGAIHFSRWWWHKACITNMEVCFHWWSY